MGKFDVRWATLIAFIVLLLGWWYWYEYRPNKIREDCAQMVLISLSAFKSDVGGLERDGPIVQKYCEAAGGSEAWTEVLKQGQARTER